jgi:hypothetical protein
MIASIATMLLAIMMLGASREGGVGRLLGPFIAVWALLIAGFLAALWLPLETATSPHLVLGIPRRSALILYGIGMLPLLGMPLAYAFTFDDFTLSESELARLRAAALEIIEQERKDTAS